MFSQNRQGVKICLGQVAPRNCIIRVKDSAQPYRPAVTDTGYSAHWTTVVYQLRFDLDTEPTTTVDNL